jgi:zinc D-Ala-D-Ala carboxypeptidase
MRNYFSEKEQSCSCCGEGRLHPSTLMRANRARHRADIFFTVNCASRCKRHNAEVGGVDKSAHLIDSDGFSRALDIHCVDSHSRAIILKALIAEGFTRIGIYNTFIHADDDPTLPQDVIW